MRAQRYIINPNLFIFFMLYTYRLTGCEGNNLQQPFNLLPATDNMKIFRRYPIHEHKLFESYFWPLLELMTMITYLASFFLVVVVLFEYGFRTNEAQDHTIHSIYNTIWAIFLIDITLHIFLEYSRFTKNSYRRLAWILSIFIYIALLPKIFPRPAAGNFIQQLWDTLNSSTYLHIILLLFSVLTLSNGLIRLLGKRTNPTLILAASFLTFIFIGTGLLMMPRCTIDGISWIDSLFIATSAVCITGLTSVDIVSTFTTEGLIILIVLVQIGGLGVMTLTSFFALFFMGNTSLYNQLVVRDMVSSNSLGSLFSTLLYILVFTLAIEITGMLFIWWSIHGTLGLSIEEELTFSAFHAISGFCNAGFSTLPGNFGNPQVIHNNFLLINMSVLVILGGIGFPILVNFKNIIGYHIKRLWKKIFSPGQKQPRTLHLYNLNTRIVLVTTSVLFVFSTFFIAYFEWNNAFSGMTVADKWTQSFFNAVCPRSGGFTTLNLSTLGVQTIFFYMLMMWIGGGAQSTAGGIKVNAFAVIVLNLGALVRGTDKVQAFGREIPPDSVRRANGAMVMSFAVLIFSIIMLSVFESELSLFALTFECVSALSTTGASLDTSARLSDGSKILITVLMFVGRMGIITLILGLIRPKKNTKYNYPKEQIIIN